MQRRRRQFAVREENAANLKSPAFRDSWGSEVAHRMFRHFPKGGISRIVVQKVGKPHESDVLIDLPGRARRASSWTKSRIRNRS